MLGNHAECSRADGYIDDNFGSPIQSCPEDQPAIEEQVKNALWFKVLVLVLARVSKDYIEAFVCVSIKTMYSWRSVTCGKVGKVRWCRMHRS